VLDELLQASILMSVAAAAIRIATPLLLAALGELVAERSGVYNMGLEGMMLMGAFTGYLGAYQSGSLWFGVFVACLTGATMALVFAFVVITLKVEQIVTGLTINLLGAGLSTYWLRAAFADEGQTPTIPFFGNVEIPLLSDIPVLGPILFDQKLLTYVAFLLVPVVWFFLFRTRYGLIVRCAGENPKALDVKGVKVAPIQYAAVVFGGLMAGLGGAFLSVGGAFRARHDQRAWLARHHHRHRRPVAALFDPRRHPRIRVPRRIAVADTGHRHRDTLSVDADAALCRRDRGDDGKPVAGQRPEHAGGTVFAGMTISAFESGKEAPGLPVLPLARKAPKPVRRLIVR